MSVRLGVTLAAIVAAAGTAAVAVPAASAPPFGHPAVVPTSGPCTVDYQLNQNDDDFHTTVVLTNNGPDVTSWTLSWTFNADQQVTAWWNVTMTQTGQRVTAASVSYTGHVGRGNNVIFGFQGTQSSSNPAPTDFAFNGVPCAPSWSPSPSPS